MIHHGRIQGIYSHLGLILFTLLASLNSLNLSSPFHWVFAFCFLSTLLISLGALLFTTQITIARFLISVGLLTTLGLAVTSPPSSPSLALLLLIAIGSATTSVWINWDKNILFKTAQNKSSIDNTIENSASRAQASVICSLIFWFFSFGTNSFSGSFLPYTLLGSISLSLIWYYDWLMIEKRGKKENRIQIGVTTLLTIIITVIAWNGIMTALSNSAFILIIALYTLRNTNSNTDHHSIGNQSFWLHPERLLILTFLFLCSIGTFLLASPLASSQIESVSFIDAAFTAVSAVCVTGLNVLDTSIDFSTQGQVFILLLIQLGGLGIMTFSTATLILLGKRLSLGHEGVVTRMLGGEHRGEIVDALKRILLVTFVAEFIGALILAASFISAGDSIGMGIWRGVFTSISAFCNAGFSLQSNNLIPYAELPIVLHTVALLIILGGLSPAAVWVLPKLIQREKISLHHKLVFSTTLFLLVLGFIGFLAFDWDYSLGHLSWIDRINNAWLQTVSARTAGFNSIQTESMHTASRILIIVLMIIGGNPGSTAGGLKTTTFAVLVLAVIASFRRQKQVIIFGRTLPHELIYRAAAILIATGSIGLFGMIGLHLTQDIQFETALFEVVSALGTVGLSIGGTAQLDSIGKVLIMLLMFAGRVGPLSLFLFLSSTKAKNTWKVPQEQIGIS